MDKSQKGITSLSCVNNVEVIPASLGVRVIRRRSGSVLKLFLREGKLIGVCWLEMSIRFLGSQPVSGDCSATRPNQPPPPGSMQESPIPSPVRQEKLNDTQAGPGGCDKT